METDFLISSDDVDDTDMLWTFVNVQTVVKLSRMIDPVRSQIRRHYCRWIGSRV